MEENQDLYDLMGDLRELGIGEDRAYFQIYIKRKDIIIPMGKITIPQLNKVKGKVRAEDILKYLEDIRYKIIFDPIYSKDKDQNEINKLIDILMERVRTLLGYDFVRKRSIERQMNYIMVGFVDYFINIVRMELLIDGKVLLSRDKEE